MKNEDQLRDWCFEVADSMPKEELAFAIRTLLEYSPDDVRKEALIGFAPKGWKEIMDKMISDATGRSDEWREKARALDQIGGLRIDGSLEALKLKVEGWISYDVMCALEHAKASLEALESKGEIPG